MTFIIGLCFLAWGSSVLPSSDQLRKDIVDALDWAGWPHDAVAETIGISEPRLSRQLNGHDPLTCLCRLLLLDGVAREFVRIHAERVGLVIVAHTDLQALIEEVRTLPKRMARASLPAHEEKERTA